MIENFIIGYFTIVGALATAGVILIGLAWLRKKYFKKDKSKNEK